MEDGKHSPPRGPSLIHSALSSIRAAFSAFWAPTLMCSIGFGMISLHLNMGGEEFFGALTAPMCFTASLGVHEFAHLRVLRRILKDNRRGALLVGPPAARRDPSAIAGAAAPPRGTGRACRGYRSRRGDCRHSHAMVHFRRLLLDLLPPGQCVALGARRAAHLDGEGIAAPSDRGRIRRIESRTAAADCAAPASNIEGFARGALQLTLAGKRAQ